MNPLEQLKDIHLPAEVSWWPLAFGWWCLIVLVLVALMVSIYWLVKRRKRSQAKREALAEIQSLSEQSSHWPAQMNSVLKRVAMHYFSAESVAALYGERWSQFLASHMPVDATEQFLETLMALQNAQYSIDQNLDFETAKQSIEAWISQALPPSSAAVEEAKHV